MVRSSLLADVASLGLATPAGAATLSVDEGGTVSYTAAAGEANRVVVTFAGSESVTISDEDRPLAAPAGCSALDARSVRCDDIADVRADLGDGDDVLRHEGTAGPLSVFGGPGQDHLMGGAGADYLVGGTDVDTIEGGAGSDRIEAALGLDVVDCGAGTD